MISPGEFNPDLHYYEKVKNKTIHPDVKIFLSYTKNDLIDKYVEQHKNIDKKTLENILIYQPKHFYWSGVDLYKTESNKMIILETNSCPSGQKSMPDDIPGHRYTLLMQQFLYLSKTKSHIKGSLAVIYDINQMELSGYAKQLANLANEPVYYIEIHEKENKHIYWENGVLFVLNDGTYIPIRAAFRFVTQKPWLKIPVKTQTFIYNPVIACLAGGRNKLIANKAYDNFNDEFSNTGIKIHKPLTLTDIDLKDIAEHVRNMNYCSVIKIPYSNSGQEVFIIRCEKDLNDFLREVNNFTYKKCIIQELITPKCTEPDTSGNKYIYDLRFMNYHNGSNYVPLIMYARKAKSHFSNENMASSKDMYLTNLSERITGGGWVHHSERLILLDEKEYIMLNINIDNLVEAYFQCVFATIAIDKMADSLYKDDFNIELFTKLNDDTSLITEIISLNKGKF